MDCVTGKTIVVLERDIHLRNGLRLLLNSWGCRVIDGDKIQDVISQIKYCVPRPSAMFIPPPSNQQNSNSTADMLESEIGYKIPWITLTMNIDVLQKWRSENLDGLILEMPCSPETIRSALRQVLSNSAKIHSY